MMTNLIGQSLGRYQILEQIGEGGMAMVYKAYDAAGRVRERVLGDNLPVSTYEYFYWTAANGAGTTLTATLWVAQN